jgi:hypothetical protein
MSKKSFSQIANVQDYEELFDCESFLIMFNKVSLVLAHEYGMRKGLEYKDVLYERNRIMYLSTFTSLVIDVAREHYGEVETQIIHGEEIMYYKDYLIWVNDLEFNNKIKSKLWKDYANMSSYIKEID